MNENYDIPECFRKEMHWNAGLERVEWLGGEFGGVNFAPAWA